MEKVKRSTKEMQNELDQCDDIDAFLSNNAEHFLDMDVSQFLEQYLRLHRLEKSEVIRRSGLNQVYAYQIFSGTKHGNRDKLLCIAIAAGMSVEDVNRLLAAGDRASLYPRVVRDALIEFALNHHYTVAQADDLLYEHDCQTLLSE